MDQGFNLFLKLDLLILNFLKNYYEIINEIIDKKEVNKIKFEMSMRVHDVIRSYGNSKKNKKWPKDQLKENKKIAEANNGRKGGPVGMTQVCARLSGL